MGSARVLAGQARRLNQEVGSPAIPGLYFFTDPLRAPDPLTIAARLPRGSAVVYRHFGALERARTARRLAAICRARGLVLLIAADPALARRVGAAGVHWPERLLPSRRQGPGLVSVAAHSPAALARAVLFGADCCVLGPVFSTASASGNAPLGLFRASQLARAAAVPVIALGGVNTDTAQRLAGRGFAGLAAVEGLARG